MPTNKSVQLQSWLNLLCRMIPGISQAVLLVDSNTKAVQSVQWPKAIVIQDDIMSAAKLAASQHKTVTTTLSSGPSDNSAVDMVIALPLSRVDGCIATLAILVNIKPSQQSVVMQIIHWGEDWLQLLLQKHETQEQLEESESRQLDSHSGLSLFNNLKPRLILGAALLILLVLLIVPGTYRVTAPASLEGKIQRVIVAPFDGYIATAFSRAGETVLAGDIIAKLDNRDLLLQQQRYAAEKNEYMRQYRKALASREKAQAHIFKSQVSQAEAQLKLLGKKIQRSTLTAPLDGVIISGDLSRSLGAPVETGEVLFEVAPLDEYRLIVFVNEKQVVDVQHGLKGVLTLKALPANELSFIVHKVSPVFEENVDGIAYRVEAKLDEHHPALRPGMQGTAKIEIDQRSYLWIYLHELYDVIRLWLWRWMP